MDLLTHLKELCQAPGLSGHEGRARDLIRAAWTPLTDEVHVDGLGSLWAVRRGAGAEPRPRLMLAAHMDAIGLMVTQIEGEFLRVIQVGGIDARVMPGQPVTVHGRADLPGVVAQPPAFLLPKANRDGVVPVTELLVDVGLPAAQVAEQVRLGDVISLAQPPRDLQGGLLAANRLDNRASVAAVTACLEELRARPAHWDVIAVATAQEEVTLGGAIAAAFALNPQLAIAIDVTHAAGPAVKEFTDKTYPLGGGPVLGLGPNIHPKLHAALKETAERLEIWAGRWALERIRALLFEIVLKGARLPFELRFRELAPGVIFQDKSFTLTAFPVQHRGADSFGFAFEEKSRRPFLAEKAEALGVPAGPIRRELVAGQPVALPDGRVVQPDEVLGPLTPGARLVHVGDCGETDDLVAVARDADALVIEATYLEVEADMAREFGHLTAGQAARLARAAGVRQLYLTHISRRYRERDVIDEAQAIFPGAIVARDFDHYIVSRTE